MTDEKDFADRLDKFKAEAAAEKAKTPKERLGESMLKAGLTVMANTPPLSRSDEKKAKGGSVKGWGKARGARKAKIY